MKHLATLIFGCFMCTQALANPSISPDMEIDYVTDIQQHLADMGFYTGIIDGRSGPATERAIMAYAKARKIDTNGQPSPELLNELNFGPVTHAGHSSASIISAKSHPANQQAIISPAAGATAPAFSGTEVVNEVAEDLKAEATSKPVQSTETPGVIASGPFIKNP